MKGSRPFTEDEQGLIANSLSDRDRIWFYIGITTGYRVSEILSIKVKDVWDSELQCIRERLKVKAENLKQDRSRAVKIAPSVESVLRLWIESLKDTDQGGPEDTLFPSRKRGYTLTRRQVNEALYSACDKSGIDKQMISSHSLRKTYADRLSKAGLSLWQLQTALDHTDISTTIAYLGFMADEEIDRAVDQIWG